MNKRKRKYFPLIFLWFLGSLTWSGVSGQEVSCVMDLPASAEAGTEIPVRITIHKGQNNDFARFQQQIPVGFTVRAGKTANADFSFRDHAVDFIWLKLPATESMVIEYFIIPDKTVTGDFTLSGRFSFIHDSDRDEVEVARKMITILPAVSSSTDNDQGQSYKLAVYRSASIKQTDGPGWLVHLLVCRADIKKLARIEESVPADYRAENVDGKDAIFSFKDGKLKYIWMELPQDPLFIVTYRIIPKEGITAAPVMEGLFSYMQDNEPRSIPIISTGRAFPFPLDKKGLQDLYAELTGGRGGEETGDNTRTALLENKDTLSRAENENMPGQETQILTQKPAARTGIYFRVQIIATSKPIQIEAYFNRNRIPGKIYREYIEGLYKYTTGTFLLYKDARQFIDSLSGNPELQDAFVTAYDGDRRIAVKQALDATGQHWFK